MERSAQFKSIHHQPMFISFPHKTTPTTTINPSIPSHLQPSCLDNQLDDSELSIFDAQKYFNDTTDPRLSKRISPVEIISLESVPRLSTASSADGYARNYRARSFHATPTASSEASWNSQTGLLQNPPGALAVSIRNPSPSHEKKKTSATKWLLSRKCPCAGKKSVQVKDRRLSESLKTRTHNTKESGNVERPGPTDWLERRDVIQNSHRISADHIRFPPIVSHHRVLASSIRPYSNDVSNGFTFPILNQTSCPIKLTLNGHTTPSIEDPARDSLEVFRLSEDVVKTTKKTMEDSFVIPASPKWRIADDDMASDASSDLFEIESFSTQTTYQMYNPNRRDSLDEISPSSSNMRRLYCRHSLDETVMTASAQTECYEPSEASIDWSVTTAEAFERSSVTNFSVTASEVDQEFGVMGQSEMLRKNGAEGGGWAKRRGSGGGGGGLLSCRHEKAVSIGPQPVKWGQMSHVSGRPPIGN